MPAGLGSGNRGRALRNFVKELVHKTTCGNSPEKTAIINGDVFDASSGVYGGSVNYATLPAAPTPGQQGADAFMPANIDVGVLGVTASLDAFPATGGNNVAGTFRVGDTTGIQKGSIVHIVESSGAVTSAAGSITFAGVVPGAPGTLTIALTNSSTGAVSTSAALALSAANTANQSAAQLTLAINADATINSLVRATNPGAPSAVVNLVALQPGMLGNMSVGLTPAGLAPQTATPVDLTGGAPTVGTAMVNHVHQSGSFTIQNWVSDPGFDFPPGTFVVASASGSPSEALVDTKSSSAGGISAVGGQDIAALLDALMAETVGGGENLPITNVVAGTLTQTQFTVGPLDVNLTADAFIGNTLTFTNAAPTDPGIQGFSTVIVGNNGANLLTVDPPLPQNPLVTDDFVITATQISGMTEQLMQSPGDAGRAGNTTTGAISEGPNTGAPANNSNVAPVPALAMMASYKFGLSLNPASAVEPNFMQSSENLSDLAGAGLTLTSFESYPLVGNYTAGDAVLSIRIPTNVGDRAIPRSGTLRLRADATTPPSIAPFVGVLGTFPIPSAAAVPFTRGPANAAGEAVITLTGATIASNVAAGGRVFIETAAMNGPKKHGFQGEVKSADYLGVLRACIQNFLAYTIPGE